ncbi:glycosyltransferase [Loktanella sp. TSTF-M6]|uniref:Glycosyltransferase n=1 Tax=Loktanella gaetbuli TaxID=2881335 RepID=A0ABS8BW68_9RHOB|nr:glycosyltransferase family 2 protein [Loktanella gaetbuli]MCB5199756.1 glycosyltransferase [Loktanella gaetbuli]
MKISIITAVYNAAATVGQAVASVDAQTGVDVEHIIVDGLSQDDTLAVIAGMGQGGRIVISEADRGIYDAINKGIARATGDVIGVVHADDYLADDHVLSDIAAIFADPAVEAVYGDLDYVQKSDTRRIVRHWQAGAYRPARLRRGWMPPHPTLFLRAAVFDRIGGYDPALRIAADYDLILRYFSTTTVQPVYLPRVLVKMRVGGESNRSLDRILLKMREDRLALRRNGIGGWGTIAVKNLSKLRQFVPFVSGQGRAS